MIHRYRHLGPLHWVIAIGGALLLFLAGPYFPHAYLWLINLLIVAVGLFIAFVILSARRKLLWGLVALAAGVGAHVWQIREAIAAGDCSPAAEGLFQRLRAWDACIDYGDPRWVVEAQALLLAGAFVVLALSIPPIKTALSFLRREYLLWRLRAAQARRRN